VQLIVPESTQVPAPLHKSAGAETAPEVQAAAAHTDPDAYNWQDRLPEHIPVLPQLSMDSPEHSLSGSVFTAIASQNPSRPTWSHASQTPPHRDWQQTPSVQKPPAHSPSAEQPCPRDFRHAPLTHSYPATQSVPWEHVARHSPDPESQAYGEQFLVPASEHTPAPLQASARFDTSPLQKAAPQTVPNG
jgi:hypothetical protein